MVLAPLAVIVVALRLTLGAYFVLSGAAKLAQGMACRRAGTHDRCADAPRPDAGLAARGGGGVVLRRRLAHHRRGAGRAGVTARPATSYRAGSTRIGGGAAIAVVPATVATNGPSGKPRGSSGPAEIT
jgi:uncharacterized membrane protein YphA (DoxX/SURF4 family)